jgi:hypothetical protein
MAFGGPGMLAAWGTGATRAESLNRPRCQADDPSVIFGWKKKRVKDEPAPAEGVQDAAPTPMIERRKNPRIETTVLTCALGEVADLSRGGMRVCGSGECKAKVGEKFDVEVCSPTDSIELRAKVVRARSSGYGRFEMGLEFEGVDERIGQTLENLARFGTAKASTATAEKAEQLRRLSAALKLPDHYATLGLTPKATQEQIQAAFRSLARKLHPDLNPSAEAEKQFCAVNEANHVLGDVDRRAAYDALAGHSKAA